MTVYLLYSRAPVSLAASLSLLVRFAPEDNISSSSAQKFFLARLLLPSVESEHAQEFAKHVFLRWWGITWNSEFFIHLMSVPVNYYEMSSIGLG